MAHYYDSCRCPLHDDFISTSARFFVYHVCCGEKIAFCERLLFIQEGKRKYLSLSLPPSLSLSLSLSLSQVCKVLKKNKFYTHVQGN